ncbi:phosphatidylinositol 3-kinase, nodule isoform-like isoform X2 [Silene latifolia]|uniref:phosphatidylinositol 3-kinase, nodule isoform-like isoform X2 n=1 Tax=Silene latifolia TaxID=37657 RepID=UPI003D784DF0
MWRISDSSSGFIAESTQSSRSENYEIPANKDLSKDANQHLWKFRFFLMSGKKALTKFLRRIEWSDVQAIELTGKWVMVAVSDALER